mgnify:CR=1 FL=1
MRVLLVLATLFAFAAAQQSVCCDCDNGRRAYYKLPIGSDLAENCVDACSFAGTLGSTTPLWLGDSVNCPRDSRVRFASGTCAEASECFNGFCCSGSGSGSVCVVPDNPLIDDGVTTCQGAGQGLPCAIDSPDAPLGQVNSTQFTCLSDTYLGPGPTYPCDINGGCTRVGRENVGLEEPLIVVNARAGRCCLFSPELGTRSFFSTGDACARFARLGEQVKFLSDENAACNFNNEGRCCQHVPTRNVVLAPSSDPTPEETGSVLVSVTPKVVFGASSTDCFTGRLGPDFVNGFLVQDDQHCLFSGVEPPELPPPDYGYCCRCEVNVDGVDIVRYTPSFRFDCNNECFACIDTGPMSTDTVDQEASVAIRDPNNGDLFYDFVNDDNCFVFPSTRCLTISGDPFPNAELKNSRCCTCVTADFELRYTTVTTFGDPVAACQERCFRMGASLFQSEPRIGSLVDVGFAIFATKEEGCPEPRICCRCLEDEFPSEQFLNIPLSKFSSCDFACRELTIRPSETTPAVCGVATPDPLLTGGYQVEDYVGSPIGNQNCFRGTPEFLCDPYTPPAPQSNPTCCTFEGRESVCLDTQTCQLMGGSTCTGESCSDLTTCSVPGQVCATTPVRKPCCIYGCATNIFQGGLPVPEYFTLRPDDENRCLDPLESSFCQPAGCGSTQSFLLTTGPRTVNVRMQSGGNFQITLDGTVTDTTYCPEGFVHSPLTSAPEGECSDLVPGILTGEVRQCSCIQTGACCTTGIPGVPDACTPDLPRVQCLGTWFPGRECINDQCPTGACCRRELANQAACQPNVGANECIGDDVFYPGLSCVTPLGSSSFFCPRGTCCFDDRCEEDLTYDDCVPQGGDPFSVLPCGSGVCNATTPTPPPVTMYECCFDTSSLSSSAVIVGTCSGVLCDPGVIRASPAMLDCEASCSVMCCEESGGATCKLAIDCPGNTFCQAGAGDCSMATWNQPCDCNPCVTNEDCEPNECCVEGDCTVSRDACFRCPDEMQECAELTCNVELPSLSIDGIDMFDALDED